MFRRIIIAAVLLILIAAAALFFGGSLPGVMFFGAAERLNIDGRAPAVADALPTDGVGWAYYGGDPGGMRYSAVEQITPENVGALEIAWVHNTGAFEGRETLMRRTAFETTPILVEGSLIFCTQFNEIVAIDPSTGDERWRYDPEVPLDLSPANQYTCRGVAYWDSAEADRVSEECATQIFMGTVDARLIAVDARTGAPCTDFGDGGEIRIHPSMSLRWPGEFNITSAPTVVADTVIVGTSISDNLRLEAPAGTVFAFDARTGAPLWDFDPVPRDPEDPARGSWGEDSADRVGHANVWSTMSVDPARGLVFLPTSSPSPDFFGGLRPGDNRYANSVVALAAETGEVVWHFQTVHHDVWDYDVPAQPGLYSITDADGARRDVVVQVTKTGFVFVLDRDTGEPVLPVVERAVPQGGVEGEVLSPVQPFPARTPPLVPNEIAPEDAFGLTPFDKSICAARIREARTEGMFTPPSTQGTIIYPFTGGGANWGGGAFDPSRNLLVINASNLVHVVTLIPAEDGRPDYPVEEYAPQEGTPYGMTREILLSPFGLPCSPPPWGVIVGVDLVSGDIVWRRRIGTTEDLAPGAPVLEIGTPNFGGPIVTAGGLVFISATMDDYLRAFNVETGEELWKGRLPAGGQATPMTYEWDGRQYVVIAAGGHARGGTRLGDAIVAFALPE
ncbi:MAG: pyrroloquinoline quinone-dependent dehydrogenase [Maricaulaceae bacterium]|jgi:quinoprotein glucose dehydrogenase